MAAERDDSCVSSASSLNMFCVSSEFNEDELGCVEESEFVPQPYQFEPLAPEDATTGQEEERSLSRLLTTDW
jgi:hypothetical protein